MVATTALLPYRGVVTGKTEAGPIGLRPGVTSVAYGAIRLGRQVPRPGVVILVRKSLRVGLFEACRGFAQSEVSSRERERCALEDAPLVQVPGLPFRYGA